MGSVVPSEIFARCLHDKNLYKASDMTQQSLQAYCTAMRMITAGRVTEATCLIESIKTDRREHVLDRVSDSVATSLNKNPGL